MELLHALVLALIQGITEFLPISSSAHLILPSAVLGWPDQGLAFDVAVHLGSLIAVVAALRADIARLIVGCLDGLRTRRMNADLRLALWVVVATLPVIVAGLLAKDLVETSLRSVTVIATTTIVFGLALWWADVRDRRGGAAGRAESSLTLKDVLLIGAAQCLALIPGTSRSGITMTAALLLGLSRTAAARFSFLLSIPTIAGAATLAGADLIRDPAPVDVGALLVGFAAAALSAFACIRLFLSLVERTGFLPYVIYRLVLGVLLFALVA